MICKADDTFSYYPKIFFYLKAVNSNMKAVYPEDKIIEKAEKFAASKKALWERAVISCLLGIKV